MPITVTDVAAQPGLEGNPAKAAAQAAKSVTFEDSQGRQIKIKQLMPWDVYQFDKFAGTTNDKTYPTLLAAFHVISIDGQAVARSTLIQVEHTLQRLGFAFNEVHAQVMIMNVDQTKTLDELMEKVKNALSTPP